MTHQGFFYTLRNYGVPVSLQYVLDYQKALERGLGGSLSQTYTLLRLICVKHLEHLDPFERAFAQYFLGLELPAPGAPPDLDALLESKPFKEWLDQYLEEHDLSLRDVVWTNRMEDLIKRFLETVAAQDGPHDGGGRWIGTGGYSPFGHSGFAQGGIRVGGASGGRSAIKVLGDRRYANYSYKSELRGENIRQVLESLKHLVPVGPKRELDLDETIRKTAKNAGELELVFTSEVRDKIKVMLLIDNGGSSMTRFVPLVQRIFSKMHDQFKDIKTYYFHNCIYSAVYSDPPRHTAVHVEDLLRRDPETRLFIIGDAAMAPEELLGHYGSITGINYGPDPGIIWLQRIRDRFPHTVWLNPISKSVWDTVWGSYTILQVGRVFHMEDLTIEGLKNAMEFLSVKQK